MTRTDALIVALTSALDGKRASLDADESVQLITVSVRLNEGGYPCMVEVERRERIELRPKGLRERSALA